MGYPGGPPNGPGGGPYNPNGAPPGFSPGPQAPGPYREPGPPQPPPPRGGGLIVAHVLAAPVHLIATLFAGSILLEGQRNPVQMVLAALALVSFVSVPLTFWFERKIYAARQEWSRGKRFLSAAYLATALVIVVLSALATLATIVLAGLVFGACFCRK